MAENPQNRREIILVNRSEAKGLGKWDKIERISKILSVVAIPVVLAVIGWIVQRQMQNQSLIVQQQLQNQTVSKEYVQLAVSILREPDQSKVRPELRDWAVDLLQAYSAVKLKDEVSRQLKSGQTVLPPLEAFTPVPSSALTPELDKELRPALETFQRYLSESGFKIASSGSVKYEIVKGDAIETKWGTYYSLYDHENKVIKVASKHLGDFDLIRHEYMRYILTPDYGANDPRDPYNEPRWWDYYAISSGLADYFPCSFKGQPQCIEGVNLSNDKKLDQRARDVDTADSIGDQAWGSAFWALREKIGQPSVTDNLLASAWVSWQPSDPGVNLFAEFAQKLIEVDRSRYGGQHVTTIQDIFRRRGLEI